MLLYGLNHPKPSYRTGEITAFLVTKKIAISGKLIRRFCARHGIAATPVPVAHARAIDPLAVANLEAATDRKASNAAVHPKSATTDNHAASFHQPSVLSAPHNQPNTIEGPGALILVVSCDPNVPFVAQLVRAIGVDFPNVKSDRKSLREITGVRISAGESTASQVALDPGPRGV